MFQRGMSVLKRDMHVHLKISFVVRKISFAKVAKMVQDGVVGIKMKNMNKKKNVREKVRIWHQMVWVRAGLVYQCLHCILYLS